VKWQRETCSQ